MRLSMDEYIRESRISKIEEAIKSAKQVASLEMFCHECHMYIRDEMVWQYKWPSDLRDTEWMCLHCAPDLMALRKRLEKGKR